MKRSDTDKVGYGAKQRVAEAGRLFGTRGISVVEAARIMEQHHSGAEVEPFTPVPQYSV